MTNTPAQAIAHAAQQSAHGPKAATGMCLQMVRTCYGVPAKSPDATSAWNAAAHKHKQTSGFEAPAGVPVFWTGGSAGHGHIAISTGNGNCWSTDISRPGYFDHVRIADIQRRWGMEMVGWTEDLNGVRVYTPPVGPSNWAKVRAELLAVLNSADAKAIPATRPVVRGFLTLTRRRLAKLPKS